MPSITSKLKTAHSQLSGKVQVVKGLKKAIKNASKIDEKVDDLEEWKRARALTKPPDQLSLADADLKEEVARILTTTNTQIPDKLVEFSYATGKFELIPLPGNTITFINMKGTTIHKESEEARIQIEEYGIEDIIELASEGEDYDESIPDGIPSGIYLADEEGGMEEEGAIEEEVTGEEGPVAEEGREEEGGDEENIDEEMVVKRPEQKKTGGRPKKLTNQFNFSERAALTYNLPIRSQETQTIPPPRAMFGAQVLQWIIYDAYDEDFAMQQREREKEKKIPVSIRKTIKTAKRANVDNQTQLRLFIAWKTLERMVNLNSYDDIAKDYRYWEDPSDEYREEEGTLLPLWKFIYEKTHKKDMVTDIMWNPWYYDLFAVTFGSLDFMNYSSKGAVCLFTMKNPSFPESVCLTGCGVMCVDIHAKYPYMIAVGFYDGSVRVYNVQVTCAEPQYQSNSVDNKHSGIVWEIKWGKDLQDGEMNFYSAAGDGKINNWVLMQNELALTTIITLDLDRKPVPGPDGTFIKLKGSATCMVFHPQDPLMFLVGTEEGFIYKCSTLYSSTYLFTYKAHHMPVYRIDFNHYNSDIFISCSGDWRIKIWEDKREEPLFVFDLASCVGDVKFAPYSSTVFAATTSEGFVFVYDLNVNKYKAICKQAIVSRRKTKLTRLAFNYDLPILIVGDDKGVTHTLKLSPNLRIPCKAPKKQQYLNQFTLQCMKLDKLLALVREPQTLEPPADVETVIEN